MMVINSLISGGIIANYYCSSSCAHCLYRCSPSWLKDYISSETAEKLFKKLKTMGISSIHIGGGEPFLNSVGLKNLLQTSLLHKYDIEYVETNSSWFRDMDSAVTLLLDLKSSGLKSLLISISPFHNEFIPFYKVKGVLDACRESGISTFPWVMDFYSDLNSLDDRKPHTLLEYQELFSKEYIVNIPRRYWIQMGGRAVKTYRNYFPLVDLDIIISNSGGCSELTDTSHFHMDLYGKYIPGLCSGLAFDCDELGKPLSPEKYNLIYVLHSEGIKGLFNIVVNKFSFTPKEAYLNKCDLCLDIRDFLFRAASEKYPELSPAGFYGEY